MIEDEFPSSSPPPPVPEAPPQEASGQLIALTPENQPHPPNRSKAEVSEDSRFKTISPNRARTLIGEKIFHLIPQKYLFEGIELTDQKYNGEHQRATGWSQDRVGTTESGSKVHVRRGEQTTYNIRGNELHSHDYHEELVAHQDGMEITVEYGEHGKDARSLHWYIPRKQYTPGLGSSIEPIETPQHITIYDALKEDSLTITPWSAESRELDPRFDAALQEMGTLLSETITWQPKPAPSEQAT